MWVSCLKTPSTAKKPRTGYSEAIAWRKVRLTKQRNVDLTTDGLWAMPLNTGWVPVKARRLQDWEKLKKYLPSSPPVPARKTQHSGATFRRAVFSAKEVPSAQDLSPRAQTHLPFGCSVVGVMWKPKAALNLQKKSSSLGLYMVHDQLYVRTCHWSSGICTGLQIGKRGFKPQWLPPEVFALFVTWL